MPAAIGDDLRRDLISARPRAAADWHDWRCSPPVRRMRAGWANVRCVEDAAAHAEAMLSDLAWVDAIFAPMIGALARYPLADPPVKVSRDALRTSVLVHDCPVASLTATILSAQAVADAPSPASIVVAGRLSVMRVHQGGGAVLRRWRAAPVRDDFTREGADRCHALAPLTLEDGAVIRLDGRTDAMLITDARTDVATLTATIRLGAAPVMREYARDDGRPLRAATLDEGASRCQMLLTLLRASSRRDAGEAFDAATSDPAFFVRWDAMRQWLAIDADAAGPRLAEMAATDPNADIRAAAEATLAQIARLRREREAA